MMARSLLEQCTAQDKTRATFCERLIYGRESVEDFAFGRRQGIEARLQALLEILEDERNEAYVGDFVLGERFAQVFRAKSAQMNHGCPADERPEESHHEIDSMIGGKNAEVSHAGCEGIDRREGDALFQVVFVGHYTALRAATGTRGVNDCRRVFVCASNETRLATSAKIFPAPGAFQGSAWRRFGDENYLEGSRLAAAGCTGELSPDGIFRDQHACTGMLEELPLFVGRELEIKRNKNTSTIKDGIR
jgi:hypothetical protein